MSLMDTGQSMRRMRRSMSLRDMSDPKEVEQTLEQILMEAVHMQNVGSRKFQTRALDELKQVRKDMVHGQVKGGPQNDKFVGLYGHVIDQIEGLTNDNKRTNGAFEKGVGAIKNAIPSTDSLVAALMTANPLMGYGVKIMRDIGRSRKDVKRQRDEESKAKLEVLRNEEQYIKDQLTGEKEEQEVTKGQSDVVKAQKREYTKGGIYRPLLTEIRDEIKRLEESLLDTSEISTDDELVDLNEQIEANASEANDKLDRVIEVLGDQMDIAEDASADQIKAIEKQEKDRIRAGKLTKLSETEDAGIPDIPSLETNGIMEKKKGGIFGMLGGAARAILTGLIGFIGAIGGAMGAIMTGGVMSGMIGGIKALVGFVGKFGGMLLRLGGKLLLPAAVLLAVFDFFDGFFNAGEILGKNDVSIGERIIVGISNVIARFVELVDWVVGLFGFDMMDTTDLTKNIANFFLSIPTKIVDFIIYIEEQVAKAFNAAIDSVVGVFDSIVGLFDRIVDSIKERFTAITDKLSNIPGLGWLKEEGSLRGSIAQEVEELKENKNHMMGISDSELVEVSRPDGSKVYVPKSSSKRQEPHAVSNSVRRAEQTAVTNENTQINTINAPVNAPTNISNTNIGGGSDTVNTNKAFRRAASQNHLPY